ncbi:hypothetical protein [Xenorhabdus littoralis]|nr:hypothetical protein [Xenorhabdus sp. Reich]
MQFLRKAVSLLSAGIHYKVSLLLFVILAVPDQPNNDHNTIIPH